MSSSGQTTEPQCSTLHHYHREKVKIIKLRREAKRREALQLRLQEVAERTERVLERKQSKNAERILKGIVRDDRIHDQRQRILQADEDRRRQLATSILTKEINAHMRQTAIKEFYTANAREKKAMDWLNRKYEASKKQAEQDVIVQAAARADLKHRAAKRQEKIEKQREGIPLKIAAGKLKAARQLRLVRKFAMIWLKKTRDRVKKREDFQDDQHKSVWIGREGRPDPMNQAEKDLMQMEPALKAIMTLMHKERTQAVADQYSRELHRQSRAVSVKPSSPDKILTFTLTRESLDTTVPNPDSQQ